MTEKLISCEAVTCARGGTSVFGGLPAGLMWLWRDVKGRAGTGRDGRGNGGWDGGETHQIDEPLQHDRSAIRHLKETQQRDQQHDEDAIHRHAVTRAAGQEARRLALEREAE